MRLWNDEQLRRALVVLGFDEVLPEVFVRLDAPFGRARTPCDARIVTTVHLPDLRQAGAFERLLRRFPRVLGAPVR